MGPPPVDFLRRDPFLALHEHRRCSRWRDRKLGRFRRNKETLTVLGPYAATGIETCGVVRRDRSTAREFTDKRVCFATFHWREDGRVVATSTLDHGYRCGERDEPYSSDPQELLRREMGTHQWNI
jgi:hypothetical protein